MTPAAAVSPPTARRGGRARTAILTATVELLAEQGFAGVTVDGVAARAGVGKATIYRHWGSKAALVIDAVRADTEPPAFVPSSDTRADLLRLLRGLVHALRTTRLGTIMGSLVDAAQRDPELRELQGALIEERRRPLLAILEAAVARDELDARVDVELAADLLVGPIFYRRVVRQRRVDATLVEPLVDAVLAALASKGATPG